MNLIPTQRGELKPALLSAAYFFFVLCSYYVLRPIRDEMGVAGGVDNLPWLFTGTLVVMLLANPLFAAVVARYPVRRFIPLTYRFFALNLVVFWAVLATVGDGAGVWVGRAFFVWLSVFNLFVVSVFWAFMADNWDTAQAKRLFGFIAVGGTLGAIAGAALTTFLVTAVGAVNLLLVSVVLLEAAVQCARRFRGTDAVATAAVHAAPIGGGILAGIAHVSRSPYLLGICAYMLLYTVAATVLYFQQAEIAATHFDDRTTRTQFFAGIDLAVNTLTIIVQVFFTARVIQWFGVGATLAFLPALFLVGFVGLGLWPTVFVLVAFQVLRRAGNYALARPARETLYTVVSREDKYKAKSLIDTFVYRAGDQVGAWGYAALGWFGLGLTGIAFAAAPLAAVWIFVALWLGRVQARLAVKNQSNGVVSTS